MEKQFENARRRTSDDLQRMGRANRARVCKLSGNPAKLSGGGLRRLNPPARRVVAAKQRSAQQMAAAAALSVG